MVNTTQHDYSYIKQCLIYTITGVGLSIISFFLYKIDFRPLLGFFMCIYFVAGYIIGSSSSQAKYLMKSILFGIFPIVLSLYYQYPEGWLRHYNEIMISMLPLVLTVVGAWLGVNFNKTKSQDDYVKKALNSRAEFIDRVSAAFEDGIIMGIPLILILVLVIVFFKSFWVSIYFKILFSLVCLIIEIGYKAIYAYYHNGQTIGKKHANIRVETLEGNKLTLTHFVLRELIAIGPSFLFGFPGIRKLGDFWVLGYLLALRENKLTLHDIIAKTQVVKLSTEQQ